MENDRGLKAMQRFMRKRGFTGITPKAKTYTIADRGYDYVLTADNGFWQRVPNLAILKKAVRYWRGLGYVRANA